jgi:hypothetical protein
MRSTTPHLLEEPQPVDISVHTLIKKLWFMICSCMMTLWEFYICMLWIHRKLRIRWVATLIYKIDENIPTFKLRWKKCRVMTIILDVFTFLPTTVYLMRKGNLLKRTAHFFAIVLFGSNPLPPQSLRVSSLCVACRYSLTGGGAGDK